MAAYTVTTELACSSAVVWPYLDDPEKQKLWIRGLLEVRPGVQKPGRVGSTFTLKVKEGPKVSEYQGEILGYEPGRLIKTKMWGGCLKQGTSMHSEWRVIDQGATTRLEFTDSIEGVGGVMRIFLPLFRFFGRMQVRGWFRALKKIVETPEPQLAR